MKEYLNILLIVSIVSLPISCKDRFSSSNIQNIDVQQTEGFKNLSAKSQKNILKIETYFNDFLNKSGMEIYQLEDNKLFTIEEYQKYQSATKNKEFYFKSPAQKDYAIGYQVEPIFGDRAGFLIRGIDIDTKKNITGSLQSIVFDAGKLKKLDDEYSTDDLANVLTIAREKLTSVSLAIHKHLQYKKHDTGLKFSVILNSVVTIMCSAYLFMFFKNIASSTGSIASSLHGAVISDLAVVFVVMIIFTALFSFIQLTKDVPELASKYLEEDNGAKEKTVDYLPENWESNLFLSQPAEDIRN